MQTSDAQNSFHYSLTDVMIYCKWMSVQSMYRDIIVIVVDSVLEIAIV